jgi:hypothetical protein
MTTEDPPAAAQSSNTFYYVTLGLMMTIIILLALLCVNMRARARRAEAELANAPKPMDAATRMLLQQLAGAGQVKIGVNRETLTTRPVELDGKKAQALNLPAEAGNMLGFQPGDIIVVESLLAPAPTTTTSPARAAP